VPVASAAAGVLHVPLDVFVVSKIRFPWNTELAMGALAERGVQVLDLSLVKGLSVSEEDILKATKAAREELEYRQRLYRAGRPALRINAKTVILVDDGIATGCSILAATAGIRLLKPAAVFVAVPVIPACGCSTVRMEADEIITVAEPAQFLAVSQWYQEFSQVSDEVVQRLLQSAHASTAHAA
jgi:predicted phosphoribosyltransferase